jgi:hypothetical protein
MIMRVHLLLLILLCSCSLLKKDPELIINAGKLGEEIIEDLEKP